MEKLLYFASYDQPKYILTLFTLFLKKNNTMKDLRGFNFRYAVYPMHEFFMLLYFQHLCLNTSVFSPLSVGQVGAGLPEAKP